MLFRSPQGWARRQHWRQRQLLWERIQHHSLQLERLARLLPTGGLAAVETPWLTRLPAMLSGSGSLGMAPLPPRQGLVRQADSLGLPPLLLLALEDELRRLTHSLHSLELASRRDATP